MRDTLDRPDVAVSEQFAQVLHAYQIENELGRTMNAYTGTIEVDGTQQVVEILHVGRIALVYQTTDGAETGFWNKKERRWGGVGRQVPSGCANRHTHGQTTDRQEPAACTDPGGGLSPMKCTSLTMGFRPLSILALSCACAVGVLAQDDEAGAAAALEVVEANTLEDLLKNVEERRIVENVENTRREAEFRSQRDNQAKMLADAEAERRRERLRGERLDTQYRENELRIGELQDQYDKRLGKLRELFGVLQQVAGDTRGHFDESIVSLQYPNRGEWLGELGREDGQGDATGHHRRDGRTLGAPAARSNGVRQGGPVHGTGRHARR